MTLRDFTAETRETLLSAMKEVESEDSGFWALGGLSDWVSDWFIKDDIASYEGNIKAYHKAILDKKDTSVKQLEAIWRNVYAQDNHYAQNFQNLSGHAVELSSSMQSLIDALDPSVPGANGIPGILRDPAVLASILRPFTSSEYSSDHAMKERILALLDDERFSREAWNDATPEERRALLQELYTRVQEILGTNANTRINFEALGVPGDTILFGLYRHNTTQITLNSDLLSDADWSFRLQQTVTHELRHAYQHETVDTPGRYVVSTITRETWEANFSKYISSEDNFQAYQEQPIEWDARGFSNQDSPDDLAPKYRGSWQETDEQ